MSSLWEHVFVCPCLPVNHTPETLYSIRLPGKKRNTSSFYPGTLYTEQQCYKQLPFLTCIGAVDHGWRSISQNETFLGKINHFCFDQPHISTIGTSHLLHLWLTGSDRHSQSHLWYQNTDNIWANYLRKIFFWYMTFTSNRVFLHCSVATFWSKNPKYFSHHRPQSSFRAVTIVQETSTEHTVFQRNITQCVVILQ